ncbi:D-alanyl-D-alanine carboxypeptidase [Hathewaya proteolytica DSM 3090]|uniref:serine-type D-Ala-D-Ala carboxypeptidase n=1 Tax=Hathewaya proteolytica DSM 3090 TaxID=1121331 RepID=A0A1M6KZD4_9CLOT|nr:D-alanyl-D-alanine carboxypeptidase family protein [Hathewaya proteolytica]SHJ64301.1 D-alanyl-D-alanine carboxypeptidase [Hathewaya proteolytica DSM 3090]
MRKTNMFSAMFILCTLTTTMILGNFTAYAQTKDLRVDARAAIAMDVESGMVLYEKSSYDVIPMASTTKIMTALVALRHGELDKKITISKRAASIGGSTVKYRYNEEITLRELLHGLMFKSGNDAAIAIAEGVGGTVEEFVNMMNEEAVNMGLLNSHFETPHGLDKPMHYTTAYDLARMTCIAKQNDFFNKLVKTKLVTRGQNNFTRDYNNINKLLYSNPVCTGVKTGYTAQAGKCLVSSFKINNREIVVVTLNCTERWNESSKIYDYVKSNYKYDKIVTKGEKVSSLKDINNNTIDLCSNETITMPLNSKSNYEKVVVINEKNLKDVDVKAGTIIGVYKILKDKNEICSCYIYNREDIKNKESFWFKVNNKLKENKSPSSLDGETFSLL